MDLNNLPTSLNYAWTATVQLQNDQIINIWYTAWPSTKDIVKTVLSISSDYPRHDIKPLL